MYANTLQQDELTGVEATSTSSIRIPNNLRTLQSTIFHDFNTTVPLIGMERERRVGRGCFNNSDFSNHFNKFSKDIPFRKLQTAILSG
jgi:hypothetical protein